MAQYEIVTLSAEPFAYVRRSSVDPAATRAGINDAFSVLGRAIVLSGIASAGPPRTRLLRDAGNQGSYDVGIPITAAQEARIPSHGPLELGITYAGRALKVTHRGPCEEIGEGCRRIEKYMSAHGLRAAGSIWEVYLTNPDATPPGEQVTEIYVPLG